MGFLCMVTRFASQVVRTVFVEWLSDGACTCACAYACVLGRGAWFYIKVVESSSVGRVFIHWAAIEQVFFFLSKFLLRGLFERKDYSSDYPMIVQ